jgi:hypothetical protein
MLAEGQHELSASCPPAAPGVRAYQVRYSSAGIELLQSEATQRPEEPLAMLVGTFNAHLTRSDALVPCFDLAEMRRRNVARNSSTKETTICS